MTAILFDANFVVADRITRHTSTYDVYDSDGDAAEIDNSRLVDTGGTKLIVTPKNLNIKLIAMSGTLNSFSRHLINLIRDTPDTTLSNIKEHLDVSVVGLQKNFIELIAFNRDGTSARLTIDPPNVKLRIRDWDTATPPDKGFSVSGSALRWLYPFMMDIGLEGKQITPQEAIVMLQSLSSSFGSKYDIYDLKKDTLTCNVVLTDEQRKRLHRSFLRKFSARSMS